MTTRTSIYAILCLPCLFLASTVGLSQTPQAESSGTAVRAADFLDSIGVNSSIDQRGERLDKTIECAKYLGVRWFRSGIECDIPMKKILDLHHQTGARFSWCAGSGLSDIAKLIETAKELAAADALLAFEGLNEPNNWGITYQGEKGGGRDGGSWLPIAKFQRDLYSVTCPHSLVQGL